MHLLLHFVQLVISFDWIFTVGQSPFEFQAIIDSKNITSQLTRSWTNTGFSPPSSANTIEFMNHSDTRLNLALIGSLPNGALKQIRIHWLLNLITAKQNNGQVEFHFDHLNDLVRHLNDFNLIPGFELMGNPSGYFRDFETIEDLRVWSQLIDELIRNFIDIYGIDKVTEWNFELWNEPDLREYNSMKFTPAGYLNYARTTIRTLKRIDKRLKIGGPAGLFRDRRSHPLCWSLLDWCQSRDNLYPLDFISFHKKGNISSAAVVNMSENFISSIREHFKALENFTFFNDESDFLSGWWRSQDWRADCRYAAMLGKLVVLYRKPLSLDNAFLNDYRDFFAQRTLLAKFSINTTDPPHMQFFKKPIYTAMGLLSLLQNNEIAIEIIHNSQFVHILATKSSSVTEAATAADIYSILISITNDSFVNHHETPPILNLNLQLVNLPGRNYKYVIYALNNIDTNPERIWRINGALNCPDYFVREKIRKAENPVLLNGIRTLKNRTRLEIELKSMIPGVFLVQLCSSEMKRLIRTDRVSKLIIFNVTRNEVLLMWSDRLIKCQCLKTYEIQFAPSNQPDSYRVINKQFVRFLSYQHTVLTNDPGAVIGSYRVRAINYWNRKSLFSNVVKYLKT